MKYKIIEDCSPYCITFTFLGITEVVEYVKSQRQNILVDEIAASKSHMPDNYHHLTFDSNIGTNILKMLPMYNQFNWNADRVSIFSTLPNRASSIHKDGDNTRFGINIPLIILDDKCVTSWYADETFGKLPIEGEPYTRKIYWDKYNYGNSSGIYDGISKLKQMTLKPNEMILFNTDIYHSWDNKSDNIREVLTLRVMDPHLMYFDQAKEILFGNML